MTPRLLFFIVVAIATLSLSVATEGQTDNAMEEYRRIDGDVLIPREMSDDEYYSGPGQGRAATLADRRWPNRVVYYVLDESLSEGKRAEIAEAIRHFHTYTSLVLVETARDREQAFVLFRRDPNGYCTATIGYTGYQQSISLGDFCSTPTIIHEIGHAIGLYHEHTRMDRDEYVEILWDNIMVGQQHNFRQYTFGTDVLEYDYESVMHYTSRSWLDFDAEGEYTILAKDPEYQDSMGGNVLTRTDQAQIEIMYEEVQPDLCIHTLQEGEALNRLIGTYTEARGIRDLDVDAVRSMNPHIRWGKCVSPSDPIVTPEDPSDNCDVICGYGEACQRKEECDDESCFTCLPPRQGNGCDPACSEDEFCYIPLCFGPGCNTTPFCISTVCDSPCGPDERCILWELPGIQPCGDTPPVPICVPTECQDECGENQLCTVNDCQPCDPTCSPERICIDVPRPPCMVPGDELRMCEEPVIPGPDTPPPVVDGRVGRDDCSPDLFQPFPVKVEVLGSVETPARVIGGTYRIRTRFPSDDSDVWIHPGNVVQDTPYDYEVPTEDIQKLSFYEWVFSITASLNFPNTFHFDITMADEFGHTGSTTVDLSLEHCASSINGNFDQLSVYGMALVQSGQSVKVIGRFYDPTTDRPLFQAGQFGGILTFPDGEIQAKGGDTSPNGVFQTSIDIRSTGIYKFCLHGIRSESLFVSYNGDVVCSITHVWF